MHVISTETCSVHIPSAPAYILLKFFDFLYKFNHLFTDCLIEPFSSHTLVTNDCNWAYCIWYFFQYNFYTNNILYLFTLYTLLNEMTVVMPLCRFPFDINSSLHVIASCTLIGQTEGIPGIILLYEYLGLAQLGKD